MNFIIKVELGLDNNILIESPSEIGGQIQSLLLKQGYTPLEFHPEAIGRSENVFNIENPEIKQYSLMIFAQKRKLIW